jgi:hypothetical protein
MQQDHSNSAEAPQSESEAPSRASGSAGRDDAFWFDHDERRRSLGISIRLYCQQNGLSLSTYRYRLTRKRRGPEAEAGANSVGVKPAFIAIGQPSHPQGANEVEICLAAGLTLRLGGASADRVLARVLERLA